MQTYLRTTQVFSAAGKPIRVALLTLLLALLITLGAFSTSGIASAYSRTTLPQTIHAQKVQSNIKCPTTAATADQSIYAAYSSFVGNVLFRVGWQPTSGNGGYGYCHVKAGHPEALNKIAYILEYGKVVANSSTTVSIRGTYPDGKQYQIYIVTSSKEMKDGRMRGIVSAYLFVKFD